MTIKAQLESSLKDAMRSGNDVQKRTIRMVLSSVKFEEINKGSALDDAGVMGIVQKEIKVRQESIAGAEKAGRQDLIAESQSEIAVLESYLPKQMSDEELVRLVSDAIAEVQAATPADMGKVMKVLLPKIQGRAANDQVSKVVRQLLTVS